MKELPVVDENDNLIGIFPINEVRERKLSYRLISIFIINEKNELLVQKRSPNMKRFPNYFETVGGHVDPDEKYLESAKRELKEELGLNLELEKLGKKRITYSGASKFVMFYLAKYDGSEVNNDVDEVSEYKFVSLEEIQEILKQDLFLPVFIDGFNTFKEKLKWD